MSLMGALLDAGRSISSLIPGIGPAVSGVFGAMEGYEGQQEAAALQQRTWDREDSAVQRRVADLRAAGLSPTLAAGSSASSAPPISSMQQVSGGEQERGFQAAQTAMALLGSQKQIEKTDAEIERIKTESSGNYIDNAMKQNAYSNSIRMYANPFDENKLAYAFNIQQDYEMNMKRWEYMSAQQGASQAQIKTEMYKAGLSEAQADAAMAQIAAKQAGEVDQYFVPWLQEGTGAGYIRGAVGSVLGKLRIPQ